MCLVKAGSARTLYLDEGLWRRIQRLVELGYARNASQLVNRILAETLGKLEDSGVSRDLVYETLKRRHLLLTRELKSLEKELRGYGGDYEALVGLAEDFELDFERLSNVDEVVPKLVREWKGGRGSLHLFITLLEKAREKKQIESRLDRFRLKAENNIP